VAADDDDGDADRDVQHRRLPQELLGGRKKVHRGGPVAAGAQDARVVVQDDVDRGRAGDREGLG
jgi:hypothetical protein